MRSFEIGRPVAGYPVQESEMAYIVLVEDSKAVADVLCEALRAEGHRCFVIRTKAGAERFFRRVRPDLVVMDCLLIGGDGLKLARELALQTDVPVIVTSGDITRAEEAEQAGLLCFQSRSGCPSWRRLSQVSWRKKSVRRDLIMNRKVQLHECPRLPDFFRRKHIRSVLT
jgi:CheY-like chemotaxis protein